MSYALERQKPLSGPQENMCNARVGPASLAPLPHFIAYGLIGVPTALVTGSGGATRRNS